MITVIRCQTSALVLFDTLDMEGVNDTHVQWDFPRAGFKGDLEGFQRPPGRQCIQFGWNIARQTCPCGGKVVELWERPENGWDAAGYPSIQVQLYFFQI